MSVQPSAPPRPARRSMPRAHTVVIALIVGVLVAPWMGSIGGGTAQVGAIGAAQNPYVERALLPKATMNSAAVSTALSSDGSTVVVGYEQNVPRIRAVIVYARSGNTYRQIGPTLTEPSGPDANDTFGESVAISSDGSTIAVGNSFNRSRTRAAAYVYTRIGNAYVVLGGAPVAVADASYGALGLQVALSGDAGTLVILATAPPSNQPTALVYTKSGGVYSRQQALAGGTSLALSTDGTTLVVGNPDTGLGIVSAYARSGGTYSPFGSPPTSSDGAVEFGDRVAVSGDGATLAIWAFASTLNPQQHVVYIFTKGVSGYSQVQEIVIGTVNGAAPEGMALNGDGTTLALGLAHNNDQDATALVPTVGVCRKSGGTFAPFGNGLIAFRAPFQATRPYGQQLALSGDGATLLASDIDDPVAVFTETPIAGVGTWRIR